MGEEKKEMNESSQESEEIQLPLDSEFEPVYQTIRSSVHNLDLLKQLAMADDVELRIYGGMPWFVDNMKQMLKLLKAKGALWEGSSLVEYAHQPHTGMKPSEMRTSLLYLARTDAIHQAESAIDALSALRAVESGVHLAEAQDHGVFRKPDETAIAVIPNEYGEWVTKIVNTTQIQVAILHDDIDRFTRTLKQSWYQLFEGEDAPVAALQDRLIGEMDMQKFQHSVLGLPQLTAHF
jgi:hypothetical protein